MPQRRSIRLQPAVYAEPGRAFSVAIGTSPRRSVFADIPFGRECVTILGTLRETLGNRVFAYCLMPDHAHLLLEAQPHSPVPTFIQRWKSRCYRFRRDRGHPEPFWQRSFFDHALRTDEDLHVVAAYIPNNPVRKGLVAHHSDYPLCGSFEFDL